MVVEVKSRYSTDDLSYHRAVDEDVRAFLDRQISDEVSANMQGAVLVDDRVSRDRAADNRGAIDDECPFTTGVMIGTYNGRPHCQRPLQHRWTVSGSVESDHRPDCLFEHDLGRKPVSTFRDHAPVL